MSLYRQTGRRSPGAILAALAAGLVIGALIGFLVAEASDDEPSLAEQVASLREDARPVFSALELVAIEYRPAVRGGEVAAPTEYQATLDAAGRAQQFFAEIRPDIEALDSMRAAGVQGSIERLTGLVEEKADLASVQRASRAAAAQLESTLGEQG